MFDVQFSFKELKKKAEEEVAKAAVEKALIRAAKNLLKRGLSVKYISDSTGLDEALVEQLELGSDEGIAQPV
jgi:predicted transposase YdaD